MSSRLTLFDCDGMLVDSQSGIASAMDAAFTSSGLTPPAPQHVRRVIGVSLDVAIARLLPDGEVRPLEPIVKLYCDAFAAQREAGEHHDPLYPGAREVKYLPNREVS